MLEQDLRTLNARIDGLIQKLQAANADNARLRAAAGEIQTIRAAAAAEVQKAQAALAAEVQRASTSSAAELQSLRARVDALTAENNGLKARESALSAERDELSRKNDLARARVEAIILRLKALESPEA